MPSKGILWLLLWMLISTTLGNKIDVRGFMRAVKEGDLTSVKKGIEDGVDMQAWYGGAGGTVVDIVPELQKLYPDAYLQISPGRALCLCQVEKLFPNPGFSSTIP